MSLVLGIDLGTSYLKFALVDSNGVIRGLSRLKVPYREDVVEGDLRTCELAAESFVELLRTGVVQACAKAAVEPDNIAAVSYSSQANTFLLMDSHRQALTPIISWQDRRAVGLCSVVEELGREPGYLDRTGMGVAGTGMVAAKVVWFQRNQPDLWSRVRHVMNVSDYLCYLLTGACVGDSGTASILGFWDLRDHQWWQPGLEIAGLRREFLSELHLPGTVVGEVSASGAVAIGLPPGIPLAVGSLDHHMAGIGAGAGVIAEASESTGTVVACLSIGSKYRPRIDCCAGVGIRAGQYFHLAFADAGGALLRDYRDKRAPELSYGELDLQADRVPPGSDGLYKWYLEDRMGNPPPRNDSDGYGHGHHARAIMEAVALRLGGLLDTLFEGKRPPRIVSTGGGAHSAVWSGIKADILGLEVQPARAEEPACLGAASFAAAAAGWQPLGRGIPDAWVRTDDAVAPDSVRSAAYRKIITNETEGR